ncbi:Reticulon-1 [Manis pentadactyla]|nr:Reticulon-1 [Manis pentadactyla]
MSRAASVPSHHLVFHFFPAGDTVLPSPRPWSETQGDSRASHREQCTPIPDAKALPYARRRRPPVGAERPDLASLGVSRDVWVVPAAALATRLLGWPLLHSGYGGRVARLRESISSSWSNKSKSDIGSAENPSRQLEKKNF